MHYPKDVTTFSIGSQFLLGEKRGQLVVGWGRAEKKQALWGICLWMCRKGGGSGAAGARARCFRAPSLGTDPPNSEWILLCFRDALLVHPVSDSEAHGVGLSAWPRR